MKMAAFLMPFASGLPLLHCRRLAAAPPDRIPISLSPQGGCSASEHDNKERFYADFSGCTRMYADETK